MFGRKWEPIEGRVIASAVAKVSMSERGHRTTQHEYVVEYSIDGGEPQRAKIKQVAYWRGTMKMINPPDGSKVPLLLHRRSGKVRFDADDPRINEKAVYEREEAERKRQFNDALNG
ncbi:MAG: hypothetical protein M3340_16835 [Actinomycetota bacterium]|nr:hypothetical protein [Actinomycetota bacterium]